MVSEEQMEQKQEYKQECKQEYNQEYKPEYKQKYKQEYNQEYDQEYNQGYKSAYNREYKSEYGQDLEKARDNMPIRQGYSRGKYLRQQINAATYQDTVQSLEQVFAAKLALVRSYQRQLSTVHDPYARKALQCMIEEEKNQLNSLADLIDMVQQGPDKTPFARTKAKISHQMRSNTGRSLALGAGIAILGMMLYPTVKEKVRPLVTKAVEGVLGMADQAQHALSSMKEDFEDIVSEAQFERLKNMADPRFSEDDFELGPDFDPASKS